MKTLSIFLAMLACLIGSASAATINWAAGIDHGFSLADGTNLPTGSLVRIGWFRDAGTGTQLTDVQIQAQAGSVSTLNSNFVEVGSTTIGSGFTPAIAAHFAAVATADTSAAGLNLVGKQMYLWVLNAGTTGAATQQAILYWDITNTSTNPDATSQAPGLRWSFPTQEPIPGSTTIDVTDLTTGTGSLAAGAHVVVGSYPTGTSTTTSAANFGLANIIAPLSIMTNSPLAGGALTSSYSLNVAATGGLPSFTWLVSAGALPNGLTLDNTGLLAGTPTQTGTFNFTVRVTDSALATTTKDFALTIANAPLSIDTVSPLPDAIMGGPYAQTLAASGGSPSYSWSIIAGSLPTGLTMSAAGSITGTATTLGTSTFTVQVSDADLRTVSKVMSLTVSPTPLSITTNGTLNNGFLTLAYSQAFAVTGGTAPYTWLITSGNAPAGLTLSGAGVLSGTPTTVSTSTFTVQVTDANSLTLSKTFTMNVLSKLIAPVMETPVFPTLSVSAAGFSYTLKAGNYPKTFSATGLPTGLKLVTTTGVISGRPTASGVFMVTIKATNTAGTSAPVTAKFTVQALPTNSLGSYVGMIARDTTVNAGLGGRIDATVSGTGDCSVTLTQGSKITRFKGAVIGTVGGSPVINATVGTVQMALTLNAATNLLTGNVNVGAGSAAVTAWRRVWNTTLNPASTRAGYYTVAMELTSDFGSNTVPQGTGYASFTVAADGGLTVSGKTADGSTITTAGFIGPSGEVLVHQVLYANGGSVVGMLALVPDVSDSFTENIASGNVTWFKPTTVTRTYPATFGPITLAVYGKYLARAKTGSIVLGLPVALSPAQLNFSGANAVTTAHDPSATFSLSSTNVPVVATNATSTTLKLTAASGAISGTFTLKDTSPTITRSNVAFQGLIVRPASGNAKAAGYFLLPQLPIGTQTTSTSPILSGKVVIQQ